MLTRNINQPRADPAFQNVKPNNTGLLTGLLIQQFSYCVTHSNNNKIKAHLLIIQTYYHADLKPVWLQRMRQRVRRGEFEGLELCPL